MSDPIQLYKSALSSFINKQFSESYDLIDPIINKPNALAEFQVNSWQRLWNLYFAILNTAADQEKRSSDSALLSASNGSLLSNSIPLSSSAINHNWSDEKRCEIASKLTNNTIWPQIIASANNSLESIPPQLFVSLVTLSLKHSNNVASVVRPQVEEYLVSIGFSLDPTDLNSVKSYLKLVEIYSTEVLADDFDVARTFVESHEVYPEAKKPELLARIDQNEKFYHQTIKEREEQEREKAAKEERERKALEEERRRERERALNEIREREKQLEQLDSENQAKRQEIIKKEITDESRINNVNGSTSRDSATSKTRNIWTPLITYWKSSHLLVLKQHKNLILFFLLIFVTASRQNIRTKVRQLLNNLWSKIFQTITMGLKVSYV
jgi:hypothetical protein